MSAHQQCAKSKTALSVSTPSWHQLLCFENMSLFQCRLKFVGEQGNEEKMRPLSTLQINNMFVCWFQPGLISHGTVFSSCNKSTPARLISPETNQRTGSKHATAKRWYLLLFESFWKHGKQPSVGHGASNTWSWSLQQNKGNQVYHKYNH